MKTITQTHKWLEWLLLAALGIAALWVLQFSTQLVRADWAFIEPRHQITVWVAGKEPYTIQQWSRAYARMRHAIEVSPQNPVLHDFMGALFALQGQRHWKSDVLRRAFFLDARRHQRISLQLRPTNGRTWGALAVSLHALQTDPATQAHAIDKAIFYAPHDPVVQRQMAALVMARWFELGPTQRNWLRGLHADQRTRKRLQLDRLLKVYGLRIAGLE